MKLRLLIPLKLPYKNELTPSYDRGAFFRVQAVKREWREAIPEGVSHDRRDAEDKMSKRAKVRRTRRINEKHPQVHDYKRMREIAGCRVTLWQCEECKKIVVSKSNEPICYGNVVHD